MPTPEQESPKPSLFSSASRFICSLFDRLISSTWISFVLIFMLSIWNHFNELRKIPLRYLIPTAHWELGSIAISLMETGQFANPYMIVTGPTAHLPPIYPWIVSLIYRWFGLTDTAGTVSFIFILITGSLLLASLPFFSAKMGLGRAAGFLGGLYGASIVVWPGHGEYLTGLILAVVLIIFLRRWTSNNTTQTGSILLGAAIGISFHLQPALLPVMVGCLVFEFWWKRKDNKKWLVVLIVLGITLVSIPWGWRNYKTFNSIFFIRSNFGLELRMGNHDGAVPTMVEMDSLGEEHHHPRSHYGDAKKLRDLGEIEYMHNAGQEAMDWIQTNPGEFLWLSIRRFANIWAGPHYDPSAAVRVSTLTFLAIMGAWISFPILLTPQRFSLLIPLATYPFIYYFMAYMPRYRIPIDWILYLLAGFYISHIINRGWDFMKTILLKSNIRE